MQGAFYGLASEGLAADCAKDDAATNEPKRVVNFREAAPPPPDPKFRGESGLREEPGAGLNDRGGGLALARA